MSPVSAVLRDSLDRLLISIGSPRTRVVLRNIAAAFSGRAINIISTFLAIPLAVRTLGQAQYGTLAVIISLTTFFAFADFGLGTALVTELAHMEASGDRVAARRLISQVWFFLIGCAAAVVALGSFAYFNGLTFRLLPGVPADLAGNVWFVLLGSSALGIPFAIAQRIFFALQMGASGQIWATAGRVSVLVGTVTAACAVPRLDIFVAAFTLLPNVVAGASTFYLFFRLRPDLRPGIAALSFERLRPRMAIGFNFTLLQLVGFAESGGDTILISQFYNSQTVAQYDLLSRLFVYVPAVVGIGMWPLWPAISAAVGQRDYGWIVAARRTGYALVTLISICSALLLWLESETIVRLWTGVRLTLAHMALLKLAFALYVIVNNVVGLQQVFLNAFNDVRVQSVFAIMIVALLLPLKYIILDYGLLFGVVGATVAVFIPKFLYFDRVVRRHIAVFPLRAGLLGPGLAIHKREV